MLGLDRLALLLERQGAQGASAAVPPELIGGPTVAEGLARARALRAEGRRIRLEVERWA
jgi:hypothetical protein